MHMGRTAKTFSCQMSDETSWSWNSSNRYKGKVPRQMNIIEGNSIGVMRYLNLQACSCRNNLGSGERGTSEVLLRSIEVGSGPHAGYLKQYGATSMMLQSLI